jgi:hypothetical protein
MKSQLNWNNKTIEIQIVIRIVRVSEHFSKMLVLSGVFNTIILNARNYENQDYMRVNYTLIVVYSMLLVTGSQSKNVTCFCLDTAQLQSLIGQSLCNAIYWSNMGFRVYWCSRWNGRIELHWNDCLWSLILMMNAMISQSQSQRFIIALFIGLQFRIIMA